MQRGPLQQLQLLAARVRLRRSLTNAGDRHLSELRGRATFSLALVRLPESVKASTGRRSPIVHQLTKGSGSDE